MNAAAFPVHDPRATWRNTWIRRFLLLLGWLGALGALGGLFAAPQLGELWAWGIGPGAAGFSWLVQLILPEPKPVRPARPRPRYLLGDQRLNLAAGMDVPAPLPEARPLPRRAHPLPVPQRQAA